MAKESNTNPRHRAAVEAILTTGTLREAARKSGVPEDTLCKWLRREDFQRSLRQASDAMWRKTLLRLKALADSAVSQLHLEMQSGTPSRARIAAADSIITHATKLHGMIDIDDRLAALELALAERQPATAAAE